MCVQCLATEIPSSDRMHIPNIMQVPDASYGTASLQSHLIIINMTAQNDTSANSIAVHSLLKTWKTWKLERALCLQHIRNVKNHQNVQNHQLVKTALINELRISRSFVHYRFSVLRILHFRQAPLLASSWCRYLLDRQVP